VEPEAGGRRYVLGARSTVATLLQPAALKWEHPSLGMSRSSAPATKPPPNAPRRRNLLGGGHTSTQVRRKPIRHGRDAMAQLDAESPQEQARRWRCAAARPYTLSRRCWGHCAPQNRAGQGNEQVDGAALSTPQLLPHGTKHAFYTQCVPASAPTCRPQLRAV